jgi:CheY-like chemotaxis protein
MEPRPGLLLVEDNEDDVFLMTRALKNAGVDLPVQVVGDGQQAVEYLGRTGQFAGRGDSLNPMAVFLDIKLPRVSGLEVLRWIRSQPEVRRLVVIVLTSSNHPTDLRQAYDLGANSYVVKPASYEHLVQFAEAFKSYWLVNNRVPS